MIYKHYKGGLYFMVGTATKLAEDMPSKSVEPFAVARYEKTLEYVTVLIVEDKNTNGKYFAFANDNLNGVYCFYRDVYGMYWLRQQEQFSESVEYVNEDGNTCKTPRFKKLSREEVFYEIMRINSEVHKAKLDKSQKL